MKSNVVTLLVVIAGSAFHYYFGWVPFFVAIGVITMVAGLLCVWRGGVRMHRNSVELGYVLILGSILFIAGVSLVYLGMQS